MDSKRFSTPVDLKSVRVTDAFWKREMELVRREVIPYQWEALNDRVPGAAPGWWMHNMRAAARSVAARRAGGPYTPNREAMTHFENLPAPGQQPDPDTFYGFRFQDSDGYKWIEAVSYQLMLAPDAQLQATAQEAVDAILAAQEPDGYLDTHYTLGGLEQAFTNLHDNHELYCLGHLAEAAAAWHRATGRDDLLGAACRFADCVAVRLGRGEGQLRGYPGHEIAEMAMVRLWEETGERRFLDLGRYFVDERGQSPNYFALEDARRAGRTEPEPAERYAYNQAHLPVREQREAVGHAVRAMYLCSGMADYARIDRDETLLEACRALWKSAAEEKMYVTGGVGATVHGEAFSRPFDLPADEAYSETCAAIGLAFFARRMLQADPDSRYADVMERALYNTVLAGMALDGRSFFYVNPLSCDPDACRTDKRLFHVKPVRQKWFGCACCPPNIARIVSSLPAYAFTEGEDTLWVHLYPACELKTRSGLRLQVEADMPWSGGVRIRVLEGSARTAIAVRLPGWCAAPEAACTGKERADEKGYARFTGAWRAGDEIVLHFPMVPQVITASPLVRENRGQVCLTRGPVVYCAEGADNGEDIDLLRVDPAALVRRPGDIEEETAVIGGVPVTVLTIPAMRVDPSAHPDLYAPWQPEKGTPVRLRLIPYFAWDNRGENRMSVWLQTADCGK